VFTCYGDDIMWLSYQVHVQKVNRLFPTLNDHFAVLIASGHECDYPAARVHDAPSQADCHNHEEMIAIEGEMCVRKNIAVNTFGTNSTCMIVYCTNHRSDCEVWTRSWWKKFTKVFPSHQAIPIGTKEIEITGENFASDVGKIKVKCMDQWDRILHCNCTWVDHTTGRVARIEFEKPLKQKSTGKIYLRLDSDKSGWLSPVEVAIVIDVINPWPSATVVTTMLLLGTVPTTIMCIYWRIKLKVGRMRLRKRREAMEREKGEKLKTETVLQHEFHGLH